MSISTGISAVVSRIGAELKALRTMINGNATDLSALTTTAKSNLVAAINEVASEAASAGAINDGTTEATSTWSSTKIDSELDGKAALVHTHTAAQVSDASSVGRSVLTAGTAAAARTAIGASSVVIGTTAGTAADAAATSTSLAAKADLVGGVIPTAQLPPLAVNEVFTVASQAAMLALTAQRGDMAIRTDTGRTFVLSVDAPATLANWKEVTAAGQVVSVAGKTGVVALAKGDVGLGSVDNTSDASKPVSTATQTALDAKANSADVGPTETDYVSLLEAALL